MEPIIDKTRAIEENGHQLVIAGPGSGKTWLLIEKIKYLLSHGVPGHQILALTFSEKAAFEMQSRIDKEGGSPDLTVRTFHSFCYHFLEDEILDSGYSFAKGMISPEHQKVWGITHFDDFNIQAIEVKNNIVEVVDKVMQGISAFRDELIPPEDLIAYIEKKESQEISPEEREYLGKLRDLHSVYAAYQQYKLDHRFIDFDDMIHLAVDTLTQKEHVAARYRRKYPYILVDEFQDTNFAQFELIHLLGGENVFVVGDDDQTIYRFRGAYLTNFDDFKRTYPDTKVYHLIENYRSSENIVSIALDLMNQVPDREQKNLFTKNPAGEMVVEATCNDEYAQAEFIQKKISELLGTTYLKNNERDPSQKKKTLAYQDFAILCRKRVHGMKIYEFLRQYNIPCEFREDVEFFKSPVIQDLIAWLRIINNPLNAGPSLFRIMRVCGIPEIIAMKVSHHAHDFSEGNIVNDGLYEAMLHAEEYLPDSGSLVKEVTSRIEEFTTIKSQRTLPDLVHTVMTHASGLYRLALEDEDGQSLLYLNKFFEIAREYIDATDEASLASLLEYLDILKDFPISLEEVISPEAVQILTIHRSKGLEFPVVFIPDLVQKGFPISFHDKHFYVPSDLITSLKSEKDERTLFNEEERRLFYVAITRAENRLFLLRPVKYRRNKRDSKPSQFLDEIHWQDHPLINHLQVFYEGAHRERAPDTPIDIMMKGIREDCIRALSDNRLESAILNLCALEQITLFRDGKDPMSGILAQKLKVTDPDCRVADLMSGKKRWLLPDDFTLSPTSLETYETCPLKFKYQNVLRIPSTNKAYFQKGTAIHKVAELAAAELMRGGKPDTEKLMGVLDECWKPEMFESSTQAEHTRVSAEDHIRNFEVWQKNNPNSIMEVEKAFSMPLIQEGGKNWVVKGRIDRIEEEDGERIVVDFKSGKSRMTKKEVPLNIQLNLYAMAIQKMHGKLPKRTSLVYLEKGEQVDYLPTEASIQTFQEKLQGLIEGIMEERFDPVPDYKLCDYCDYGGLCPRRAVEGEGE